MKNRGEEIRRRFPRIIMNLVMALIFWVIGVFIPPTVGGIPVPSINANADFVVLIISIVVMSIFIIRALADALVLGDILVDVFVKKLGIREERSPKRAARDFIYIIIVILIVTAVYPILVNFRIEQFATIVTYVAIGFIILLIYDIGRVLHRIIEEKAELLADRLVQAAEKEEKE